MINCSQLELLRMMMNECIDENFTGRLTPYCLIQPKLDRIVDDFVIIIIITLTTAYIFSEKSSQIIRFLI